MSDQNLSIRDVVNANLCLGCGACAVGHGGVSAMRLSDEGYLRPSTDVALDRQDALAVCPGVALDHEASATPYHSLWGPAKRVLTGHCTDPEVRFVGSSGGVLSALAIALVESKQVAFVLQTRADPDDPIGNLTSASRSRADILEAAGSRYGPSSPIAGLDEALATGETFAFIGKPCDAAALRKLARIDERVRRQIPYIMSFFCAGIPSRKGTVAVLRALDTDEKDVRSFRYRGEGWPGMARVTRQDGSTQAMDYNSSWGTILNRHLQFRCKICPDGTGEFADISCADAWFGKDGYPDFEEREGRSLIIARTEAGERLLSQLEASGALSVSALDSATIEAMQPYQAARKRFVLARSLAVRLRGRLAPQFHGLHLWSLALGSSWYRQLRNFAGMLRRLNA